MPYVSKPSSSACPYCGTAIGYKAGEMAVAYFKGHAPRGFLPVNNGGELAVIYCFIFLFIAVNGAGNWSLDHTLSKKMNQ